MLSRHPEQERAIAASVRRRVSAERECRGGDAVTYLDELDRCAAEYADRMSICGDLSHDLDDTTAQERTDGFSGVGENIHRQKSPRLDKDSVARQTVAAWINSHAHRRNMLRERVTVGGVGVSQSGDWYYVCLLLSTGKKAHARVADRVSGWLRSH